MKRDLFARWGSKPKEKPPLKKSFSFSIASESKSEKKDEKKFSRKEELELNEKVINLQKQLENLSNIERSMIVSNDEHKEKEQKLVEEHKRLTEQMEDLNRSIAQRSQLKRNIENEIRTEIQEMNREKIEKMKNYHTRMLRSIDRSVSRKREVEKQKLLEMLKNLERKKLDGISMQITQLNAEIWNKNVENRRLTTEYEKRKKILADEYEKAEEKHNEKKKSLEEKHENMEIEISLKEVNLAKEFNTKKSEEISKFNQFCERHVKKRKEEEDGMRNTSDAIKRQQEDLIKNHRKTMERMKVTHDEEIIAKTSIHSKRITKLDEEYNSKKRETDEKIHIEDERAKNSIEEIKKKCKMEEKAELDRHNTSMVHHHMRVMEMNKSFKTEISELEKKFRLEKKQNEESIIQLRKKNEEIINSINQKQEERRMKLKKHSDVLASKLEQDIIERQYQHTLQLNKMDQILESKKQELNGNFEKKKDEMEEILLKLLENQKSIESDIHELKSKSVYEESQKLSKLSKEVTEMSDNKKIMETEIRTIRNDLEDIRREKNEKKRDLERKKKQLRDTRQRLDEMDAIGFIQRNDRLLKLLREKKLEVDGTSRITSDGKVVFGRFRIVSHAKQQNVKKSGWRLMLSKKKKEVGMVYHYFPGQPHVEVFGKKDKMKDDWMKELEIVLNDVRMFRREDGVMMKIEEKYRKKEEEEEGEEEEEEERKNRTEDDDVNEVNVVHEDITSTEDNDQKKKKKKMKKKKKSKLKNIVSSYDEEYDNINDDDEDEEEEFLLDIGDLNHLDTLFELEIKNSGTKEEEEEGKEERREHVIVFNNNEDLFKTSESDDEDDEEID